MPKLSCHLPPILLAGFVGCGAKVYRPAPLDGIPAFQVDSPEVAAALEASPQTPLPARVAIYAKDAELAAAVADTMPQLQAVSGTYAVQNYLLDGRSRWSSPYYAYSYSLVPPSEFDLEEVRVAAARAHCDVLLLVDHGTRQRAWANGWVVLSPLIVSHLAMPFLRVEDQGYVDATLIDVRNGYLYGQVSAERKDVRGPITLYAIERPELRKAQRDEMLAEVWEEVGDLLWAHLMPSPREVSDGRGGG